MNVVLIGMKHCGKSTLGARLAQRLECPFHDVDALIEDAQAAESGRRLSTRVIFAQLGEEYFHRVEGEVVARLCDVLAHGESDAVVAVGGRTALNEPLCERLARVGLMIYLRVEPRELWTRVLRSGVPPFISGHDPWADFLALCRRRQPYYERHAHITVDLDGLDQEQATEALLRRVEEHRNAR
jgi:shikimate kinase